MRLAELEPQFIRYESRIETWETIEGDYKTWAERGRPFKTVTGPRQYSIDVPSLAEAQGIQFLCPKCFIANKGNVGTHGCEVTFRNRNVLDEQGSHTKEGKPVRWDVSGTSINDLTTMPSVLLQSGCGWHGFITNGEVSVI